MFSKIFFSLVGWRSIEEVIVVGGELIRGRVDEFESGDFAGFLEVIFRDVIERESMYEKGGGFNV